MASDSDSPTVDTPHEIPLQDLSRPEESHVHDGIYSRRRRRSSSGAGSERGPGSRRSILRNPLGGRYERIEEGSPQRQATYFGSRGRSHDRIGSYPRAESPVEGPHRYQVANPPLGLSFDEPQSRGRTGSAYSNRPDLTRIDSSEYISNSFRGDLDDDADTTPLRGQSRLQPIHPLNSTTRIQQNEVPQGQQSVRWLDGSGRSPSRSPHLAPSARLGDDLPNLESGTHNRLSAASQTSQQSANGGYRERSLSPRTSMNPISRAGSIVRMVSQRVVNLSNEPEVVESTIRRKSSESRRPSQVDARLSFDIPRYNGDGEAGLGPDTGTPPEKEDSMNHIHQGQPKMQPMPNPLKGRSLGIFSPENNLRRALCEMLVHPATEPIILALIIIQTVLLAVDAAPSVYNDPRSGRFGQSRTEYALFVLFVIYTLELAARCIVSGFISNPYEYTARDKSRSLKEFMVEKAQSLLALDKGPRRSGSKRGDISAPFQPSVVRSFTGLQSGPEIDVAGHGRQQQRIRLARRAFLRHSFNRLDFVAVVSFWISFAMTITQQEASRHVFVFRMLSCLRILRLLGLTSGTSVILRSLKKAAPSLLNVAFLIGFFWLLFAIIGVQSFKSSLRRTCVWVGPPELGNYTQNIAPGSFQPCGGYLNATTGLAEPWKYPDGTNGTKKAKGFLCPQNSICVEGNNPYNGTVSFDNVPQSIELVFVIMTSNTFSDLMYYLADTDHLFAAVFFAAGIVIMSLWLMNLLIAVITTSFQIIREESKRSAFATEHKEGINPEEAEPERMTSLKRLYDKTHWLWIAVITLGLIVQCLRSATMSLSREKLINNTETVVTLVLALEIVLRFASDWRNFFSSKRNIVDLGLAVITCVVQIPPIRSSGQAYAWLSIFQIARIYRVVMAFEITRELIMVVFSNIFGLLNLILFVFLVTFLAAILASQLFRGELPYADSAGNTIQTSFFDIWNSFIGMYIILSSENWTGILYNVTQFEVGFNTAWLGAIFFIMWYILANFIVLNMFIAVIQEGFDVSEDEKRLQQVKAFLQQKELGGSSHGNLTLSSIFKFGKESLGRRDPLDYGPATMEMLLKDAVVREFLDEDHAPLHRARSDATLPEEPLRTVESGTLSALWSKFTGKALNREPNPFYSRLKFSKAYEDLDPRTMAREVVNATEDRKRAQRQYLQRHPHYNVSLFIFGPHHPIRRLCQSIVGPGRGAQRIEGVDPFKPVWYSFSAFIYAAVVCMVVLACVTTPLYQREWFATHKVDTAPWYVFTDMGFAILFSLEAIIKVIADGFFWTPNAYFRSSWGFIDGIVLITLWINVITALDRIDGVSRAVGAFKALRALRLLNISNSARETFHSVIITAGWKVISAAFVSLSLLIPFAIWGVNLFNGKLQSCNDGDFGFSDLSNCVGEYESTPYNWTVLAPRQMDNSWYSFDNFGSSLFILFQIVSLEGWTQVMWDATSITGRGRQPADFASQGNAVYFIIFNLLGAVFVLTLFISVFMRNYTEQTGVAYLTADQRSWLELRKLLRQISPSKRSIDKNSRSWRVYCHKIASQKRGKWARFVTSVLLLHLALLLVEFYPIVPWWETLRDYIFLGFTVVYIFNIFIRIAGLSWSRFRSSSWDMFSLVAVTGSFISSFMRVADPDSSPIQQLHKLFLVAVVLLLIPRNDQLDQLFKTAAASLAAIGNLLATWFVLFLVFAIAFTQAFGLTRFGDNETGNINFRDVPKALILLFRVSVGEGWNQLMEDFASIEPPFCVFNNNFFESDCGSDAWARVLFIAWNIISMYLFVSMFVSLIFESFSYVYQQSNGLSVISRDEIRRFKHAWQLFDPEGTGYIPKEAFPRLLGELSGIFQMRIYDGDYTVSRILEDCKASRREAMTKPTIIDGVDIDRLRERINSIPVEEIRRRRARMNVFFEEMLVSADPDRGISFSSCLMIIAHYNVINDSKSLR